MAAYDPIQEKVVVSPSEVQYYHQLGLGRGVNVTHPDMWKTKTPFLVRKASPDLTNIIGTQECGVLESYETEVSTFSMHKQKLRLSLQNPTAPVKLGIDEQYSRSSTSTKLIKGEKIEKRTISFESQFDEVPLYDSIEQAEIDVPECFLEKDCDYSFEENLASWLLKRIDDREKKAKEKSKEKANEAEGTDNTPESNPNPVEEHEEQPKDDDGTEKTAPNSVEKLAAKLKELDCEYVKQLKKAEKASKEHAGSAPAESAPAESAPAECTPKNETNWVDKMLDDCKTLIKYLDITHYVSAIKLGACYYSIVTTRTEQKTLGVGASVAAKSLVEGGMSGEYDKRTFHKSQKKQKIGRIENEDVTDEAVIGFEIQPLYKIVRIQFLQMLLRRAVMDYVHSKEDASKGPYLISAKIGKESVFWKVNESDQLTATESATDASLFYVIPAEDTTNPSDFHIAYWPKKGEHGGTMHVDNTFRTYNKDGPPVPYYLSCDTNLFGQGKGTSPLTLKTTVKLRQARFCLHSRVQSSFFMCTSTPVSLNSWFESEQFFIKCSHHFFKMDGYIATMVAEAKSQLQESETSSQLQESEMSSQSQKPEKCGLLQALKKKIGSCCQSQAEEQSQYKVTVVGSVVGSNPDTQGMLFKLHPKGTQEKAKHDAAGKSSTDTQPPETSN